jgi:signal transduction histidine kinase/CheY-like chemotaxis protein/integral membrane sensor domain MASE1
VAEPLRRPASYAQGRLHSIAVHLLLIAAYVASGRLGLFLAVSPGYATAIFPPAGVAATAAVVYGIEVLPSVFVASFALNLWIGISLNGNDVGGATMAALVIAAASALQAGVAGTALRRAIGYPMALDTGRDLRRFLALPPLCCLISATLSLAGLWALGAVARTALLANWVTWWVGDTLGVLVVLPLVMVLAGEPRSLWRARFRPVALPMLLFFGFFVAVFVRVSTWENDQAMLEFQLLSQQASDRVRTRLEEQELFLVQLQGSFEQATAMPGATFTTLVKGILERFSMIRGVAWAPRVEADQRAEFESAQRAETPGFEIRRLGPRDALVPAGLARAYYPVLYVEPKRGNEQGLGFDVLSDPQRGPAVAKALAANRVIATVPLPVGAPSGQPTGILVILPVPSGGAGPGLVLIKLQIGAFITDMLAPMSAKLTLRLVDTATEQALFDDFPPGTREASYSQGFDFGERHYEIQMAPSALYMREHRGWQSWALLVVGVLGTGLLGALLMLGTGYTNRIERQIEERTGDLAAANRLLRIEIDERRNAEAALRHAQRMEAIGQLTGGIAHDFNNLLTVISANAELIHNTGSDEAALRRSAAILRATERGERLTRQLLAFSRRQNLRPEVVDLRHRTAEMAEMLARSTRDDIQVSVEMPDELWPVSVDPAEFELAVLNIAVNARDAMPDGGHLSITARNATIASGDAPADGVVGDFVALVLKDTGTGMSPETLARAFEPYFTTKEVGAGSGLGLSQVYGFANQSGGTATIDSEPGVGTTVTLSLPRATGRPAAAAVPTAVSREAAPHKILVVEDEAEIAELTGSILRELGHDTVHARDGTSALAMVRDDPAIGLVISDIVMPGATNGLELARALRVERPTLPVLLVTGYSQYGPEVAGEAFELLEKPYRRETLINAVRTALEGRAPGPDGIAAG